MRRKQTKCKCNFNIWYFLIGVGVIAVILQVTMLIGCKANEGFARKTVCKKWPVGTSPSEMGKVVANDVLVRLGKNMRTIYYEAFSLYSVLMFSEATKDTELRNRAIAVYGPFLRGEKKVEDGHLDNNAFGILPFEIFRQTGKRKYLPIARHLADEEFDKPREDELSRYTRFWVDDMYMIGTLQAQAYRSLGNPKYLERSITHLLAYIKKLQQPNGLFHHTPKALFFLGRGNGWAAVSMTEILLTLPKRHPERDSLLRAYRKMMAALVNYQDKSGMWHQLLDYPESYMETSCTGMFIFAIATGVDKGWLPANPYWDVAERGWLALTERVESKGPLIKDVCPGTNEGYTAEYYLNRPRHLSNLHGHMSLLWAATAMVHLEYNSAYGSPWENGYMESFNNKVQDKH